MKLFEIRPAFVRAYFVGAMLCTVGGIAAAAVFAEPAWVVLAVLIVGIATLVMIGRSLSNQIMGRLRPALLRDLSSLLSLHRMVEPRGAVPPAGGWAAEPDTLLELVSSTQRSGEAPTIVECGSGTSTIWVALALSARGNGRVIALEHDASFRAETLASLERLGVASWADVRHAPLEKRRIGTAEAAEWYDASTITDLDGIDVLFVDGPPSGATGRRGFAFDELAHRVRPGGVVILDDTARPFESADLARWLSGPFRIERRLGRSTMLRRDPVSVHGPGVATA
ncbi:O-methyltransferase [Agromyces archimandritae]|uniref:Class I SAM-dependent methyltransferase n=1 Tax=Agromyces archimandritae TaxID=2781962 RepID=A0A975IPM1_9MICO|nr:class I SAM-dependent methyltransferase [Agromyces archimandritae]QTX05434.1 class I SAM-dependent methyltransferase [Agromyces archimandritae]